MMTDCFEQQLPIDAVEVAFYVNVEHPVMPPAALTCCAHGIDRRTAGSVAIGVGMEHRLETRLQITATSWAMRSATVGIPNGRMPPSAFGISTRRTGGGK
jgi:hypothetical protein